MTVTRIDHVTCLGCGCGCDDLAVTVTDGHITQVEPVCPVGRAWFGDGIVPGELLRAGQPVPFEDAIAEAAELLSTARGRSLVFLGSDLSSQAQRQAVAIADLLDATVETTTSPTAAAGLLVAQRRGRAAATLGEIRNRADVLLFWGVDPAVRYPRFMARYVDPIGTHVPNGRSGRTIVGISVGRDRAPQSVDIALRLEPGEEVAALSIMRAAVQGRTAGLTAPHMKELEAITQRMTQARYVALVHDAEPTSEPRDSLRVEGLIALTQALNGPTRAALVSLRMGGNCVGAESVLTWQTGYPFSVDFTRGTPRYSPSDRSLARLGNSAFQAGLFVGTPDLDESVASSLGGVSLVIIGPRASRSKLRPRIAIDTGVAGIHEPGTAYRLDEVPLRLRPPLRAPRSTTEVLGSLTDALRATVNGRRP